MEQNTLWSTSDQSSWYQRFYFPTPPFALLDRQEQLMAAKQSHDETMKSSRDVALNANQVGNLKGEQGFDAHFLACHAAGVQSSCERIYGNGAEALCQARKYNRCEVVKSDDPSCKYSTKASCDGDPGCAWCLSGAVPPACNTLAEARALPPSVFKCDKVDGAALL